MNILYFGKICEEELLQQKLQKEQPYFIAQYFFEKALTDCLEANQNLNLEIYSINQTEYYPKDLFYFSKKARRDNFYYLNFFNLPYIREVSYFLSTCFAIIKWYMKNKNKKDKLIYASCHFPPVSLAIVLMGKLLRIKKIVTFTDLSLFTYSRERIKNMKLYKKLIIKPYLLLVNKLQKSYDGYILFSKEMNKIVNTSNKPYTVIEGIYNKENLDCENSIKKNAIAHAGSLNKEVGIDIILDVFNKIEDESIELWLIGKGDMSDELIKRSQKDKRIKYFGFMPREEVFEKLKQARLLVNLRNPEDTYTKYSFPSKMFEYMASGTPVFTTKLKGIPEEYYKYLYTVDEYNIDEMSKKIINILKLSDGINDKIGEKAKTFVMKNKNKENQTNKVVLFLRQVCKG